MACKITFFRSVIIKRSIGKNSRKLSILEASMQKKANCILKKL